MELSASFRNLIALCPIGNIPPTGRELQLAKFLNFEMQLTAALSELTSVATNAGIYSLLPTLVEPRAFVGGAHLPPTGSSLLMLVVRSPPVHA